jgi:hypothetical protein
MPSYVTGSNGYAGAIALQVGDTVAVVNNAATDTGVTNSQQVNIEPTTDGTSLVGIVNNTNQSCTIYSSAVDVLASYVSTLTPVAAGAVYAGSASGFLLLHFGTAPTTGSAYIRR